MNASANGQADRSARKSSKVNTLLLLLEVLPFADVFVLVDFNVGSTTCYSSYLEYSATEMVISAPWENPSMMTYFTLCSMSISSTKLCC